MLFVVGQLGRQYFEKRIFRSILTSNIQFKILMLTEQELSAEDIVELFREKSLDEVYIVYTRMVNSVTFDAEIKQLLPLKKVKFEEHKSITNIKHVRSNRV